MKNVLSTTSPSRPAPRPVDVGLACVTSPCCTQFIMPLGLALLAGTPAAVWLTPYIGWVYGGLTLVSVMSLVLGLRWLGQ